MTYGHAVTSLHGERNVGGGGERERFTAMSQRQVGSTRCTCIRALTRDRQVVIGIRGERSLERLIALQLLQDYLHSYYHAFVRL